LAQAKRQQFSEVIKETSGIFARGIYKLQSRSPQIRAMNSIFTNRPQKKITVARLAP
jgi:hypothetical protein